MAATARSPALDAGASAVNELSSRTGHSQASIMDTVRIVGGAMIGIAVLVVVLNEVFSLDSIDNSTGPFSGISDRLVSIGTATMGLLIIGLLVLGANRVMGFFGRGGF